MSGIFPQEHAGGLPVRDSNGNPIVYENVENAYVPPKDFSVSCSINFLPSDCTARFEPRHLNAIQSELLALAVRFDPKGNWDCDSPKNIPRMFTNWTVSDDFYNVTSSSICTRAGTHTKNAAQARVLRMLHCGANGIEASGFGQLTDVILCGYSTQNTVTESFGIITCGANGPVKITYKTLSDHLYATFGIQEIKDRLAEALLSIETINGTIFDIQQDLTQLRAFVNTISDRVDTHDTQIVMLLGAVADLQARVGVLEQKEITKAVFNDSTYVITYTRRDNSTFTTNLAPIRDAIDGKFDKPQGTITQYVRGDGTLATLPVVNLTPYQTRSEKNQANGYAGLGADGKLLASQLPAIAISDTFVVNNEAEMLALTVQVGDIAVRRDLSQTFILQKTPSTVAANWVALLAPTAGVESVIGLTGPISQAQLRAALGLGSAAYQNENAFVKPTGNSGQYIRGDGTMAAFPSIPGTQVPSDWNASSGVARILNKPTLGTASTKNIGDFATSSDGALARSAIQQAALNTAMAAQVSKSGDTMTGQLTIHNNVRITNSGGYNYIQSGASGTSGTFQPLRITKMSSAAALVEFGDGTTNFSGAIVASGNISAYSDARLKSNIETVSGALDKVLAMRGVTFTMNGEQSVGVIAQEMRKVMPEVVHAENDRRSTLSVSYGNLVGVLIEAIKELNAEIEILKASKK